MALSAELLEIKMRLQGAAQYVREMERSAAATEDYGVAAKLAGEQAKSAAVGLDAMAASSTKGVGALTRMKTAGEGLKSTGSKLTSAWTVPIALIGGVGVKMALDFSDSMEQIATQAGASQREVGIMTRKVEAFAASGKSSEGPNQLAKGLFSIESAGFRGKRAFEALVKSEELATVGHADFEKTSKAVAAAMATQIKGTENLGETVGLMNSIVGIGSMRMEDLLSAMGTGLLDKSAALGLSLQEVGGALGVLTTTGTPAAASSTRMAMAFNMMAAPTEKAAKAMESIGLTESQLAMSMRKRGLVPTIELLKSKLDETFGTNKAGLVKQSKAVSEMFGGGRTSGGIISLMRHVDLLQQKTGELTGSEQKFNSALEHTNEQPITKLHQAWAQLQVVLIEIGNALIPVVTDIAQFFVGAAHWMSSLPGPAKTVLLILAGTLAVAGPLLSMIGTMTLGIYALGTAFEALDVSMAGIPLLIGAVAAVAVNFSGILGGASHHTETFADLQERLKNSMEQQHTAGKNLVNSEHHLAAAKHRSAGAAKKFGEAQGHVNAVVREYGPNSKPAIHAEQQLAEKRWSLVRATHAKIKAERLHKIAAEQFKQITRTALLSSREEIEQLKTKRWLNEDTWRKAVKNNASSERLNQIAEAGTGINKKLQGAQKKQNEILLEAAQKVGPKYAEWLKKASNELLEFGSEMKLVNHNFERMKGLIEHINELPMPEGPERNAFNSNFGVPRAHPEKAGPPRPHHRNTAGRINPRGTKGGPTLDKLETGRYGGRGGSSGGVRQPINVELKVGRRKFGEAMVMAFVDEEVNE